MTQVENVKYLELSTMKCMTCFMLQYLLAMVFAYFKRAGFSTKEFTRINFFVAL